jgi:DNA-binding FadR family transcriptional regulator
MSGYVSRGLHGRLVQELGSTIASGQIAPGERVDVEALEGQHGVSRTVVREAIRVLATKGLVDARPKRGTFVLERQHWNVLDPDVLRWLYSAAPDMRFLESLNEVRQIIEPAGARLAAMRRTDADVVDMRAALDEMAAEFDLEKSVAADIRFHHALTTATHNEMLQQLGTILEAGLRARDLLIMAEDLDADVPTHAAVLDAIEAGDPDRAESAMHVLLERSIADAARA